MDEFGKSPLLAITALMTSAALAAAGLVLQPPEGSTPEREASPFSVAVPAPAQRPAVPDAPQRAARLTPAPEMPGPSSSTERSPLAAPIIKPWSPGPYAPRPVVTIPGPPSDADRPSAPASISPPKAQALASLSATAETPSLRGATPPPHPGGKPLPPPPDYAAGPYAPSLAFSIPRAPVGPGPAEVRPTTREARQVASLPRSGEPDLPSLKGAIAPPRPSGKPSPPIRDLGVGPYAPPLTLAIAIPPSYADEAPPQPGETVVVAAAASPRVMRAMLPSLRGTARPPHPAGKPPRPTSTYPPGPYVSSLSLTIPSPPLDFVRFAPPPDSEAAIMRSPAPPGAGEGLPPLNRDAAPPTPSAKPRHERQVAAIAPLPMDQPRSALDRPPDGSSPAIDGHRLETGNGQLPPWRRYAALAPADDGRPMVAIILDDLGLNHRRMARAIALPKPLTLAILPYATQIDGWAERARAAGHELMLHLPMEPDSGAEDPGPNALLVDLGVTEIERRIDWNMARFRGYVGVNNHMGSRFTADGHLMRLLMERLKNGGLLFVDSLTTSDSVGSELAHRLGVPTASRDIFLDNDIDVNHIAAQLAKVEHCARRKGYCIAIGHPHPETLKVLERWLPTLRAKGFQQVPISAIIARRMTG